MAVESPGWANQASTYGAEQTRRAVFAWAAAAGGVKASGDLAVTAPVSGMTCNVATGEVLVPGSSTAAQGLYYGKVTSTSNLAVATSNPTNPRIDMVYAAVTDAAYTGATNTFVVAVATGTPTSGATLSNLNGAPSLPTSAIILAYILVPAASTSVTDPDILDQRVRFVVSNAASLTSASTQAFTGKVSAPALIATGLTGAIAASRYVGATASGAPSTGTFAVGDFVIDQTGVIWICTTLGTPGTWTSGSGTSPGVTQIGQVIVSGSTATSIDLASIPATYRDLMLVFEILTSGAANVQVRFNGDTGANYTYQLVDFNATSITGSRSTGQTAGIATFGTSSVGGGSLLIPNYRGTVLQKIWQALGGAPGADTYEVNGVWASTAAINQVTLLNATFSIGTCVTLYGIGS